MYDNYDHYDYDDDDDNYDDDDDKSACDFVPLTRARATRSHAAAKQTTDCHLKNFIAFFLYILYCLEKAKRIHRHMEAIDSKPESSVVLPTVFLVSKYMSENQAIMIIVMIIG